MMKIIRGEGDGDEDENEDTAVITANNTNIENNNTAVALDNATDKVDVDMVLNAITSITVDVGAIVVNIVFTTVRYYRRCCYRFL